MKEIEHKYFECDCLASEHRLVVVKTNFPGETPTLTFDIFLSNGTFFERVLNGLKYIFGYKSTYGHFANFILNPEKTDELITTLRKYKEDCLQMSFEDAYDLLESDHKSFWTLTSKYPSHPLLHRVLDVREQVEHIRYCSNSCHHDVEHLMSRLFLTPLQLGTLLGLSEQKILDLRLGAPSESLCKLIMFVDWIERDCNKTPQDILRILQNERIQLDNSGDEDSDSISLIGFIKTFSCKQLDKSPQLRKKVAIFLNSLEENK